MKFLRFFQREKNDCSSSLKSRKHHGGEKVLIFCIKFSAVVSVLRVALESKFIIDENLDSF